MTETGTQAQTPLTRIVDGAELPVPGRYAIDASHSAVEFVVRHLGIAKVRGRFDAFDGVIEIADRSEDSKVTAVDEQVVDFTPPFASPGPAVLYLREV